MAAHRYWRAVALKASGGGALDLSEFQLLAGTTRVDSAATLTSNIAPSTGSLANLNDDNLSTGATWSAADLNALALSWDFGSGGSADVTDIRLGAADNSLKFLTSVGIQYSDDNATWAALSRTAQSAITLTTFAGIRWPGARTKTASTFSWDSKWSPLRKAAAAMLLSDDYTTATTNGSSGSGMIGGGVTQASGVRQFEIVLVSPSYMGNSVVGVSQQTSSYSFGTATTYTLCGNGQKYTNSTASAFSTAVASGSVIGVVVDFNAGSVAFYVNGASRGTAFTGLSLAGCYPTFGLTATIGGSGQTVGTLKTTNFAFPISGASAWGEGPMIDADALVGSPGFQVGGSGEGIQVTAPLLIYGQTIDQPNARLRDDFLIGALGQQIGRVRGTTLDYAAPVNKPYPCRVRLIREKDGLLVREAWSAADGSYDFQYLDELQSYSVLAYYAEHGKRAVIGDGLTLANGKVELMP